jgi:hypothetical protein
MEHGPKLYAAKTVSWPGATPFCPAVRGPNPLRTSGVTPGHDTCAPLARSVFCRVRGFKIMLATLQRLFVEHLRRLERNLHAPTETTGIPNRHAEVLRPHRGTSTCGILAISPC